MKKSILILTTFLTINLNNAFQGSQLIQKERVQDHNKSQFLDTAQDEYTHNEPTQQDLEEYDQYNCDSAHPPKPSAITALLTEIFGFVFLRYITIREITHVYCHEIKERINTWFSGITKA